MSLKTKQAPEADTSEAQIKTKPAQRSGPEEPWVGYDADAEALIVEAIEVWAEDEEADEIVGLVVYELHHRARRDIVYAAERALAGHPWQPTTQRGWINYVFTRPRGSHAHAAARLAHLALAWRANVDGVAGHPTHGLKVDTIAAAMGCSKKAAQQSIRTLTTKTDSPAYVEVERTYRSGGQPGANVYILKCPPLDFHTPVEGDTPAQGDTPVEGDSYPPARGDVPPSTGVSIPPSSALVEHPERTSKRSSSHHTARAARKAKSAPASSVRRSNTRPETSATGPSSAASPSNVQRHTPVQGGIPAEGTARPNPFLTPKRRKRGPRLEHA